MSTAPPPRLDKAAGRRRLFPFSALSGRPRRLCAGVRSAVRKTPARGKALRRFPYVSPRQYTTTSVPTVMLL